MEPIHPGTKRNSPVQRNIDAPSSGKTQGIVRCKKRSVVRSSQVPRQMTAPNKKVGERSDPALWQRELRSEQKRVFLGRRTADGTGVKGTGVEAGEISNYSHPGAHLKIGRCAPAVHTVGRTQTVVMGQIRVAAKNFKPVRRLPQDESAGRKNY